MYTVACCDVAMQCHRYFLSGSHDSTVTVWDFDTLMPVKNHYNYDSAINDASFSHDSQYLALGGDEHTIKINHTISGEAPSMPELSWVQSAAWHINTWLLPLCEASFPCVHHIILTSARPYRNFMLTILIANTDKQGKQSTNIAY